MNLRPNQLRALADIVDELNRERFELEIVINDTEVWDCGQRLGIITYVGDEEPFGHVFVPNEQVYAVRSIAPDDILDTQTERPQLQWTDTDEPSEVTA